MERVLGSSADHYVHTSTTQYLPLSLYFRFLIYKAAATIEEVAQVLLKSGDHTFQETFMHALFVILFSLNARNHGMNACKGYREVVDTSTDSESLLDIETEGSEIRGAKAE
jgi:hypothetical protein